MLALASVNFATSQVTGKVSGSDGTPIAGVNVVEKGTSNGAISDFDGNYEISAASNATLVFSYVGYETLEVQVANQSVVNVTLQDGSSLDEVILVGSRTAPRSNADSPLPVDVLQAKELSSTGQATFDKALQYKIPLFNTVQTQK